MQEVEQGTHSLSQAPQAEGRHQEEEGHEEEGVQVRPHQGRQVPQAPEEALRTAAAARSRAA